MNPIKQLRKEKELTRNEMSLILDVPYSTLAEVENDNYANPDHVVKKIASVFKVSEDLFLKKYNECRQEKRRELMKKIK